MPLFTVPIHEANDCHVPAGRADGGQFCSKGGSANLTTGTAIGALLKSQTSMPAAVARVQQATGVRSVWISDHPHALGTAEILATTLAEMRAKGYTMPDDIEIQMTLTGNPAGRVSVRRGARTLRITIPMTAPLDLPVDTLVSKAFGGVDRETGVDKYAGHTMRDLILHEMGHVLAGVDHDFHVLRQVRKLTPEWVGAAAGSVSGYARHGANEFLAEAFVRLYRGEKLSADAQSMYNWMRGPKIL